MATPQAEDGHTDIANPILDHLVKTYLSAYEWQVLMFIIRKTYGWHKKEDSISLSQFVEGTGISKQNIRRTIRKLTGRNMLTVVYRDNDVVHTDNAMGLKYCLQKDFEKWKPLSIQTTVVHTDNKSLSVQTPTKETIQKKRSTKIPPCIPPKGEPPKKRACTIPTDFALSDSLRSWAETKAPHLDIEEELEQFKDNHYGKGSLWKDWDAAFRTWIRNAIKFSAGKGTNNSLTKTAAQVIEVYQDELAKEGQGEKSDVFGGLEAGHEDVPEIAPES